MASYGISIGDLAQLKLFLQLVAVGSMGPSIL